MSLINHEKLCVNREKSAPKIGTSDFQSEVGEVFGEIGGELPAKFGRRFSSFFCWENRQKHIPPKLHRKFHHQTSLRGSGLWRALQKSTIFSSLVFHRLRLPEPCYRRDLPLQGFSVIWWSVTCLLIVCQLAVNCLLIAC